MSITRPNLTVRVQGFSLLAAIFLLVVLAMLAAYVASVSSTQNLTQAFDINGSQAQQAARAGIEWAIYQINEKNNAGTLCTGAPQTPGALPGMNDFTINVICQSSGPYTEGSTTYSVYQVTVTACNASVCPATTPAMGYVENQQQVRVMK